MKDKVLRFIIAFIVVDITIFVIEICCIYAVKGDNAWNYIKDFLEWYFEEFFRFSVVNGRT